LLDTIDDSLASVLIAFDAKRIHAAEKSAADTAGDAVAVECFLQE
jgi:hypothetical protein